MYSLCVENFSFFYNESKIFIDLNFNIKAGEIIGILGPNGCGKSTLLTAIASAILEGNKNVRLFKNNGNTSRSVSIIPQDYKSSFFPWASLSTNLKMFHSGYSIDILKDAGFSEKNIMDRMGIDISLKLRPAECSGGMLQQVALIRALAKIPNLLLADEPFSALDFNIASIIRTAFRSLIKENKIPTLIVLHDIQDIVEICDRVFVIPGRPYSSSSIDGAMKIEVITNTQTDNNYDSALSFIEAARRLLIPKGYL